MTKRRILIVDDEELNLDIIQEYLEEDNYETVRAEDGLKCLEVLSRDQNFDVILLDRMMPNMNGMDAIKKIKADDKIKNIPIIMQTAAAASEQIREGIAAGVFYYLTKPFEAELLRTIIKSAIDDFDNRRAISEEVQKNKKILGLMESGKFKFRTLEEAKNLAYFISNCFPDPERVVFGLNEIFVNSVEHGNLHISYKEKGELIVAGKWTGEIERRLELDDHKNKRVTVIFETTPEYYILTTIDEGEGFDWKKYEEIDPLRATDPHGRGIAISKMQSFDEMEYRGKGNEVVCRVRRA
jgi:CheY-like chemotaxis protein/anti-sigma regulatory factor (Ser/Thr protein kinase)